MVEVSIEGASAVFMVQGWDKLWALRSRLEVPLAHIAAVHADASPKMGWFQGLKVVGTDRPPQQVNDVVSRQDTNEDGAVNASWALHTAARRYCLEQHAYWCERYSEIVRKRGDRQRGGYRYTTEALATFPRYNVLNAIRVEIERIDPVELGDTDSTRNLLVLAGQTAEDDFTRQPIGEIEARAISEERDAFCSYIRALTGTDLNAVEKLPYRRVLTAEEAGSIWTRLRSRWQIPEGHWYPLTECNLSEVEAFKTNAFDEGVPYQWLRDILVERAVERVWELREYGPEYQEDLSLFKPYYNGAEGYWSSSDLDWIIYVSHECSVTVGGWLLSEVKRMWPSWQGHRWTTSGCRG